MKRFTDTGRWIIPLSERKQKPVEKEEKIRYVVEAAYCPHGCSLVDKDYVINGSPGIRIKFRRPGVEGQLVISAIEGDFDKVILSGDLENGVKDELFCPHCDMMLKKLVNCNCQDGADMIMIGLTPELDFNNAVVFCNVTGCENGSFVSSGDVLRHIRLQQGGR